MNQDSMRAHCRTCLPFGQMHAHKEARFTRSAAAVVYAGGSPRVSAAGGEAHLGEARLYIEVKLCRTCLERM